MRSHSVSRNTALLTGASVIQKLLSFGYFWYLSSQLGKPQLGVYLFALSFATLFGSATDLGLTPILIRESSRTPGAANRYLRNVVGAKLILATLTVALAALAITISGKPTETRQLVYLASVLVFFDAFTLGFWGMFKAARNLSYESLATVVVQLVIITGGVAVMQTSRSTLHLVGTLGVASLVNFALAASLVKRELHGKLMPQWDPATLRAIGKVLPAFALSLVFVKIFNVVDIVLLGYLADNTAVANYAIPAKVVTALQQIIPATFAAVIFPVFTQKFQAGTAPLSRLFERAVTYLLAVSLPVSATLVILAPQLLGMLWPAYTEATGAFRVMALSLPFMFLAFPTGYLLNACDRQRRNTANRGAALAVAVAGNVLLIPMLGYFGSAVVWLGANMLLLALDVIGVRPLVRLKFDHLAKVAGKVAVATTAMGLVLVLATPTLTLPLTLTLGALVFIGAAIRLKILGPRPLATILGSTD